MTQVARMKIEASMKGKKLPFDDQVMEYLLSVAPGAQQAELLDLLEDFCPKWSKAERVTLAAHLKSTGGGRDEGSRDFPSLTPPSAPSASSRATPAAAPPAFGEPSDVDHLAADMMLAQMLQEEEDARAALNNPAPSGNAKKGKKAFRTLNINYTVARGGNAGPALGTAAPSSLADVLRQKRSQQVLDTGPPSLPTAGAAAPGGRPPGPWAPGGGGGLSWAERVQLNQEPEQSPGEVPVATAGGRALHPLKVRVRAGQVEHHVEAQPKDTVGDVKSRLEKMHGITFSLQRLLHQGRELKDHEALQPMSDSNHQIPMQLYLREGAPKGFVHTIQVQLHLPGSSTPTATTVPEKITGAALKEQIEKEQGIRKDHINLTFFGHPLRDDLSISEQGVAAGGRIQVSIMPAPSATLAVMQTSAHGRVLDESEAVQAAIQASQPSANGVRATPEVNGHQQDLDEDHQGPEDLAADGHEDNEPGDFLKDVAAQEPRFSGVVNQAKAIAGHYLMDDYIGRVSKRNGYRLTLLMHKTRKDKVMGFLVFRFRLRSLLVLQLGVARDSRGRGAGRALLRWAAKEAQRANMDSIMVSSWPYGPAVFGTLGFAEIAGMDGEDVRGQVWELHLSRVKPKRGGDGGGAPQSRKELVRAVFHGLNRSGNGVLSAAEMKPFAEHTGFAGSEEEWRNEFEALKRDCGVSDVGLREFENLVNDQSDNGCYCSDEELRSLWQSLPPPARTARPNGHPPAPAPPAARTALIQRVFAALNRSCSGQLSASEMRPFAEQTGFEGSDQEWQNEYALLTRERRITAIGLQDFDSLVNDESEAGCYCSDADLQKLLDSLPASRPSAPENVAVPPKDHAPPQMSSASPSRSELIRSAFHALNKSGTGDLSGSEMKPFAEQTGFDGSDEDWEQEFAMLKKECNLSRITLKDFEKLVNDQSEEGCYCSDDDLQKLLKTLSETSRPRAPENAAIPAKDHSPPQMSSASPSRSELIRSAFHALNKSGTGDLSGSEMKPFAEQTGFDGTDEDWEKEFAMLKQECKLSRITAKDFEQLVNDQSEEGCYCSDEDLQKLLQTLSETREAPFSQAPSPSPVPNGHGGARRQLIASAFGVLNRSGSGRLSAAEMRPFAELTGFEGSDDDWRQEFELLQQECNGGQVSLEEFVRLVDDDSENGCYCNDADLRSLLEKPRAVPNGAGRSPPAEPPQVVRQQAAPTQQGRSELLDSTFRALNRSGSGHLSASEMRPFAELTGFEGTDADWREEFKLLRQECSGSQSGILFKDFERLANDESEDGCYCADDVLRGFLDSFPPQASRPAHPAESPDRPEVTPIDPTQPMDRPSLVASSFRALNWSGSGQLSAAEMRPFAELTGFSGTDKEWQEEFDLLRQECHRGRVDFNEFQRLIDDQSDNGCYATSEDLESLLNSLKSQNGPNTGALSSTQRVPPADPAAPRPKPAPVPPRSERGELVARSFQALNRSGSGQLSSSEMRPFAELTGFQGTDAEWQQEFDLLRQECSYSQIGFADFARLVDDESEDGCYATDQQLQQLLDSLAQREPAQRKAPPPRPEPPRPKVPPPRPPAARSARQQLIHQVFAALNRSGSGDLSAAEMRPFADRTGFQGSNDEWLEEFNLLRRECYRSEIRLDDFERLVNDESEDGCYASDQELRQLLEFLSSFSSVPAFRPPPGLHPPDR